MKTVKIYIETTIAGPAAPKRGGYAVALTFTLTEYKRKRIRSIP